jgi:hypothetical protein
LSPTQSKQTAQGVHAAKKLLNTIKKAVHAKMALAKAAAKTVPVQFINF